MNFEQTLSEQTKAISEMICRVYHMSAENAIRSLKASDFYRLLSDENTGLWIEGSEMNFLHYQNEIEYGIWNKKII